MAAPGWSQCTYQILAFIGQHEKRSALSEKIRFARQGKKSSKPQSDNANCNDSCRKQKNMNHQETILLSERRKPPSFLSTVNFR